LSASSHAFLSSTRLELLILTSSRRMTGAVATVGVSVDVLFSAMLRDWPVGRAGARCRVQQARSSPEWVVYCDQTIRSCLRREQQKACLDLNTTWWPVRVGNPGSRIGVWRGRPNNWFPPSSACPVLSHLFALYLTIVLGYMNSKEGLARAKTKIARINHPYLRRQVHFRSLRAPLLARPLPRPPAPRRSQRAPGLVPHALAQ
jgi:hypothetical protein